MADATPENSVVRISAAEWGAADYDLDVATAVQMPSDEMLPLVLKRLTRQGWRVDKNNQGLNQGGTMRGTPISRAKLDEYMALTCLQIMKERYHAEVERRRQTQ